MTVFEAEVIDIRERSRNGRHQRWQMLLDRTAFSPIATSGTLEAVSPSGARLQVPVLGIVVEGEEIWHLVDKPLAAGTPVTGSVNDSDAIAG
ncbi:hypothetical protein [Granulicella arctica]|uniref:Alanyl-tRNA synthetase n=1 Tax=Granulicella arctica TaxID=940613 RepID=A0A7Y9TSZ8_9BACT|nr:hypothetical protein [Granulicella arctica]NYF79498.1 alanyl-tRNA synthetase [Granulicella arctica]